MLEEKITNPLITNWLIQLRVKRKIFINVISVLESIIDEFTDFNDDMNL